MDLYIQLGDSEKVRSRLKKLKDELAKASKNVHFKGFQKDELAQCLLPDDLPVPKAEVIPAKTTGNGDCLYNAVSVTLKGDESLSRTLREMTAGELYLNAELYSQHEHFNTVTRHQDAILGMKTYKTISLTDKAAKEFGGTNNFQNAIKYAAKLTCKPKSWSALIHMFALATVLERDIWSIYPDANKAIRPLLNSKILPLKPQTKTESDKIPNNKPIYILWSRDGNFDNRKGAVFEPNHFVPLIVEKVNEKKIDFEEDVGDEFWLSINEGEQIRNGSAKTMTDQNGNHNQNTANHEIEGKEKLEVQSTTENEIDGKDILEVQRTANKEIYGKEKFEVQDTADDEIDGKEILEIQSTAINVIDGKEKFEVQGTAINEIGGKETREVQKTADNETDGKEILEIKDTADNKIDGKEILEGQNTAINKMDGKETPEVKKTADNETDGKEKLEVKDTADNEIDGKEILEFQRSADNDIDGKETPEVQKNADNEIDGKEIFKVKDTADNEMDGKEILEVQRSADNAIDGKETPEVQSTADNEIDGKEILEGQKTAIIKIDEKEILEVHSTEDNDIDGKETPEVQKNADNEIDGKEICEVQRTAINEIDGKEILEVQSTAINEIDGKEILEVQSTADKEVDGKEALEVQKTAGNKIDGKEEFTLYDPNIKIKQEIDSDSEDLVQPLLQSDEVQENSILEKQLKVQNTANQEMDEKEHTHTTNPSIINKTPLKEKSKETIEQSTLNDENNKVKTKSKNTTGDANKFYTEDIYSTSDEKPLVLLMNDQRKAGMKRKKTVNEPKLKKSKIGEEDSTSDELTLLDIKKKNEAKSIGDKKSLSTVKPKQKKKSERSKTYEETNTSDEENENDETIIEYESDIDYDILNDEEDQSDSDSDKEDDSSEEQDTISSLKWTHKLTNIAAKKFSGPNPGSTHQLRPESNEIDYFYAILPESVFNLMANSTNAYKPIYEKTKREKSKNKTWTDLSFNGVDINDIKAYIGIRMIMGLNPKPSVDDYWSTNPAFQNALISKTMSRRQFRLIQRYFHVNDPTKDPMRNPNREAGKEALAKDPLYKVSPLMEKVRKNSMKKYNLHQQVSVDEAMIKCHGQHWSIVGAPNKPAKRGFKIFVLADAVSGFLWNFQVYLRRKKEEGLTQRVVENLTEDIGGRNHIVFVDKFYTSIPLALSLMNQSTFISGSFNTGRRYWPTELKIDKRMKKKEDKIKSMQRGDIITRQTTDGKLVATVWQDTKTVYNLSNCYSPITNSRRDKVERKTTNSDGKYEKKEFACPQAIVEFNKYMGGVDRHDHLRSNYTLQRSSTRWWTYFAWFAFDMALINGYLVYKDSHPKATHKGFQLKVAEQLIGGYSERIRAARQKEDVPLSSLFAANHEAISIPGRARACRYCSKLRVKNHSGRTRETTFGCAQCEVSLHRECFVPYHQTGIMGAPRVDIGTQTDITKTPTKLRCKSPELRSTGQGPSSSNGVNPGGKPVSCKRRLHTNDTHDGKKRKTEKAEEKRKTVNTTGKKGSKTTKTKLKQKKKK